MQHIINYLSRVSPSFHDDLWLVDSTPVECGRSRETTRRSELAGWAEYGYCASHSRYFWGLRLHLLATASGLPILWALAPAKEDERDIALEMLARSGLARPGQTIIADKGYRRASFHKTLNGAGITLIRPPRPKPRNRDPGGGSSARSARSSSRSTTPSKPSLISNGTADVPKPV